MKTTGIAALFLTFHLFCAGQNNSRLQLKSQIIKSGQENFFEYHPIANLSMPDKIAASILFLNDGKFHNKLIRLIKTNRHYKFSFKVPGTVSILLIAVVDNRQYLANFNPLIAVKKTVLDNNDGTGFIYYSHSKMNKQRAASDILLADLLEEHARYLLDIKSTNTQLLRLYETAYQTVPSLKKESSYINYLSLLHSSRSQSAKATLLAYANKLQKQPKDEIKWLNVMQIYGWLEMNDKMKETKAMILSTFPDGKLAKEEYWNIFYTSKHENEDSLLDLMTAYKKRFNDSTAESKDKFYNTLVHLFSTRSNWAKVFYYEDLITDKFLVHYTYNKMASKLCGTELDSTGTDLATAKILSKRSVDFAAAELIEAAQSNEYLEEAQGQYNRYLGAYAMTLFKLRQYDSAFLYQDIIYRQPGALTITGYEKYAAYAEMAKGAVYAKQAVEKLLLEGITSKALEKQLTALYKQLNITDGEFEKLKPTADSLFWKTNETSLKAKYGTTRAAGFSLMNMMNETVSLSQFRNKVVILDFWANWCSPCKASFAMMNRLIKKYKDDEAVVFLFIDVWEGGAAQLNLQKTKQYMEDNKYPFNVLFDVKNKVAADYKITGIPTKVIINKQGEIINVDENPAMLPDDEIIKNISFFIEAAKK